MTQDRKKKVNFTLPTHVVERLRETGNASQYIAHVLDERWGAWTAAVARLAGAGWTGAAIKEASAALACVGLLEPGEGLLESTSRLLRELGTDAGMPPAPWTLADSLSLLICAREQLAYNAAFHRALERLDAPVAE
jgi:hypothetical protein